MESTESSSPIVTRAVAAALRDRYLDAYDLPGYQRVAMRLLGGLPQTAALWLVPRANAPFALGADELARLTVDELVDNRLKDYDQLKGRFPAIVTGVAMGGATAHLSVAAGGPFLPQAFVLTLRGGAPDGNVETYFRRSDGLARALAAREPGVMTIQHYDPVHDGWLTRWVNHLRIKLIDLPERYKVFLRERLVPGGAVIFLEGQAAWLRYRTGERSVFQVGGWGAISPEEFLNGSPRLSAYARQVGLAHDAWRLSGYPLEEGPESEWGSENGFGEALERFCQAEGYRFIRIPFRDPNHFSRLAFHAVQCQLALEGRSPAGVIVETFSQFDATAVARTGLLPLWLIFNTRDSLDFLRSMTAEFPPGKPLFFSPLATYSLTPDIVPWRDWEAAFKGREWINIGARASHYPADARATVDWADPLRAWAARHTDRVGSKLSGEQLLELAKQIA